VADTPSPLTNEQLSEALRLIKGADSVELKLSVSDSNRRSAVAALEMDPLEAQIRQIVFFDTPDLTLNQAGVVVRARRIQRKNDDSVVKLRPVVPDELPREFRASPQLGVEVDVMPGGFVCSASMKAERGPTDLKEVLAGQRPIRKLFTKEQRAFYARYAPAGIEIDDLSVLGPINVLKLKFFPKGFNGRFVAELWNYPDGSRILELSTKCLPNQAIQVAAEGKGFLAGHGVDISGVQQTKTRVALDFFTDEIKAAVPATV